MREQMDPHVEYRECPRLPDGPVMCYRFGSDGSVWHRYWGGPWRRKIVESKSSNYARLRIRLSTGRDTILFLGPLVLSAFGQPRPLGFSCSYRDGDGMNCRLDNLSWAPRGNTRKGRPATNRGSDHGQAVLTESLVAAMRREYLMGATLQELAEEYGVESTTARNAITGKTWSHVPGPVKMRSSVTWGSGNGNARLDEIDVAEIKRHLKAGRSLRSIAREYGVGYMTIRNIAAGESWIHVPDDAELVRS